MELLQYVWDGYAKYKGFENVREIFFPKTAVNVPKWNFRL